MVEKILMQEAIEYKRIDEEQTVKLYKIKSKYHLLYIKNKGTQFMMNRDFFDYLDSNSLPYVILLHDVVKSKLFFLELKKEHNWIKSCFATCDKDNIFLGKQVLNYPIDEMSLCTKLKTI